MPLRLEYRNVPCGTVLVYAVLDVTAAFKDKTQRHGLLVRSKDLSLRRINRNEQQPFW